MPYYNLGEFIDEAVDSVLSQDYANWELLIVDDGSTEAASIEQLKKYESHSDTRITLYRNQNQGVVKTRNFGIAKSKGEYIVCLDADDIIKPTFLRKLSAKLDADQDGKIGFVMCHWELFGYETGDWKFQKPEVAEMLVDNYTPIASMYRKSAWEKVGGYNDNMKGYEDWNLWLSMISAGYEFELVEETLFRYRRREGSRLTRSMQKDLEIYSQIIANNLELYKKHFQQVLPLIRKSRDDQRRAYSTLEREHLENTHMLKSKVEDQEKYIKILLDQLEPIQNSIVWQWRTALLGTGLSLGMRLKLLFKPAYHRIPLVKGIVNFVIRVLLGSRTPKPITVVNQEWVGPLVSVVIPLYNYGHYIDDCIQSVLDQGLGDKVEIIIVEGFSSDGTRELAAEKNSVKAWPRTRVIFQPQRTAIGENRLTGIQAAKGKYVVTLDADDMLGANYLKLGIEKLEKTGADVGYFGLKQFGEGTIRYEPPVYNLDYIFTGNCPNTPALFRKSFWEENQISYSLDKDIFEDWDFWMRMSKAGARFVPVYGAYQLYRVHAAQDPSMTDLRLKRQKELEAKTALPFADFKKSEWFKKAKERQLQKLIVVNPGININWEKQPFISIITPVYNGVEFVESLILRLQEQSYRNFEHIIVDGGSTDGTVEVLKKYSDSIRYISEKDHGQSDAINKGFRMAAGEVVTWLGVDDYYENEGVLQTVADYFQDPANHIIVGKAVIDDRQEGRRYDAPRLQTDAELLIRWWIPQSIPTQPAIFHRRKILDEIGLLDTSLHFTMDHDLWSRMLEAGYEFKQVPEVFAVMVIHDNSKTGGQLAKFPVEHERVAKRYWGKPWQLTYWRRFLQHKYAKYWKFKHAFAK